MVLCQICKEKEATQKHHVSYYPELTIDICKDCHILIHKHGVGDPRDSYIIEDAPLGIAIPIQNADIRLIYKCMDCGEYVYLTQRLINLLLLNRSLREPRNKCNMCKGTNYDLVLENTFITTDHGPHSFYEKNDTKRENSPS